MAHRAARRAGTRGLHPPAAQPFARGIEHQLDRALVCRHRLEHRRCPTGSFQCAIVAAIDNRRGARDDDSALARGEASDLEPAFVGRLAAQDVKLAAMRGGPSRGAVFIDAIVKAHELGQRISSAGVSIWIVSVGFEFCASASPCD